MKTSAEGCQVYLQVNETFFFFLRVSVISHTYLASKKMILSVIDGFPASAGS